MTREKAFYIAYEIGDYIKNCESSNEFEAYELCMYISDLANDIMNNNTSNIQELLNNEFKNVKDESYVDEVVRLINLLNECVE